MDIDVRPGARGAAHLLLTGDLDFETADDLVDAADRLLGNGTRQLVVDLAGVDICDSSGLSALISVQHAAQSVDGGLRLVGIRPRLRRVLQVTGLDELLTPHEAARTGHHAGAAGPASRGGDRRTDGQLSLS